jgi:alpha-tubulin suppressor-like RCC1 family protein
VPLRHDVSVGGVRVAGAVLLAAAVMASAVGAGSASAGVVTRSASASPATLVSGGNGHTCAVVRGGLVKCWGLGTEGELGDGSVVSSSTPVTARGLRGMRQVASGGYHSCAISSVGSVSCWGYNFHGELGAGTRSGPDECTRRPNEPAQPCSTVPLPVVGLHGVLALAAGAYHTCALLADRTVSCWGYGGNGQLGTGSTRTSSTPRGVLGLKNVRAITAGGTTSCARLLDGTVRCWGGAYPSRPSAVPGVSGVVSIAAGYYHVCAALENGTVACWGSNSFGQLGDGTFTSSPQPVTVLGVRSARSIAGGEDHACALLADGTVRCWGYDQWGQIGVRPNVTPATSCDGGAPCHPVPVRIAGLTGVREIAAGFKHTCFATTVDTVKCVGYGGDGELGQAARASSFTPLTVPQVKL